MKFKVANQKFWKNKRVFLTGHSSFKGTWLKLWLEYMGAKVDGYSINYPSYPRALYKIIYKKKINREDILNFQHLKKRILKTKPDIVFHFAAQSILSEAKKNPIKNYQTNIIGTATILEACSLSINTKLVSIITTDKCYEENNALRYYSENSLLGGSEPYSASKASAEIISKSYQKKYEKLKKKIITLRAGNVVGGGDWKKDRLLTDVMTSIEKKTQIILRSPHSIRPWQHVLDCLNGYLLASEYAYKSKKTFNSWNFSPPLKDQISVIKFVKNIISNFNYPIKKIIIGKRKFYESARLNLVSKKAKKEIKWKTILTQKNVILFLVEWYKAYYRKDKMKIFSTNQILNFYKIAKGK